MRPLVLLAFSLAFPVAGSVFASSAPPSADGNGTVSLAERLSGIERSMWERDPGSIPTLRTWASKDVDEKVRARALGALTLLRDTGARMLYLDRLASDPSARVRRAAADAIGTLGIQPDRIDRLADPLRKDPDPMVRAESARALGKLGARNAIGSLMFSAATDPSPEVRSLAVEALSRLRATEAAPILTTSAREDRSPAVRSRAVRALAEISPVPSRDLFESLWREKGDAEMRFEAYQGLVRADSSRWVEAGLEDAEPSIRFLALRTWFSGVVARPREARPVRASGEIARLVNFLKDPSRGIREFSRQSLERLGYKTRPEGFFYTIDDR